jgi:ATP-dependent protease ClpP protease subunit
VSPPPIFDAAKDEATVYVYDAIGGWFGIDPKVWVPEFSGILASKIHLRINSPGGSVFDAEAMRTAVKQHKAKVIAHVDGYAASAATLVAIAAKEVEISAGAMFMIHDAWGALAGGSKDMRDYADMLEKANESLVTSYVKKTGQAESQVRSWMEAETWFTAAEALKNGFVDRIFQIDGDGQSRATAQASLRADFDTTQRARALLLADLGGFHG